MRCVSYTGRLKSQVAVTIITAKVVADIIHCCGAFDMFRTVMNATTTRSATNIRWQSSCQGWPSLIRARESAHQSADLDGRNHAKLTEIYATEHPLTFLGLKRCKLPGPDYTRNAARWEDYFSLAAVCAEITA